MTWAQRLKRVFNIDLENCRICGGTAKVIACIEDPVVIKKILAYRGEKTPMQAARLLPDSRAPLFEEDFRGRILPFDGSAARVYAGLAASRRQPG